MDNRNQAKWVYPLYSIQKEQHSTPLRDSTLHHFKLHTNAPQSAQILNGPKRKTTPRTSGGHVPLDTRTQIINTWPIPRTVSLGHLCPKYIFLCISKWKFQGVRCTFWVRFQRIFNIFCWNLERILPDNQARNGVRELCFASFKSYDYFSEEIACFINSQSWTACQKQTRQVIKISQHCVLEKGVKKA